MTWVASRRLKKYKICKGQERHALYEALNMLATAVGSQGFLGGDVPNEADFNIYGILRYKAEELSARKLNQLILFPDPSNHQPLKKTSSKTPKSVAGIWI